MSFRVEERPVREHMPLWRTLLASTRETPVDDAVLAWRYLANPHGIARAWVIVDDATGEVGGFTVVMPRRMRMTGRHLVAWVGADFSILPRFRALGPALQLRRAARLAIDAGEADLLFAFPNEAMRLIHERAGHERVGQLHRHAYPVVLATHLERAHVPRWAARTLALPAEIVLGLSLRAQSLVGKDRIMAVGGPDAELPEALDAIAAAASADRIAGVRDAEYLRWRYFRQPGWSGGVLTAMREKRYTGYLVFTEAHDLLQISDYAALDRTAADTLLRGAITLARKRRKVSVSWVGLENGIWDDVLRARGFRVREEGHAVYAYVPARHVALLDAGNPGRWHFTVGDRDI